MTMYTLPHFCRVCLKYDKNLIDLEHIENEPNETLMSKLQYCVSGVEWNLFKPLLCHPCIKRLNITYNFKKQCLQSASVLKSYVSLVTKSNGENEQPEGVTVVDPSQSNAYMMLPNQKYIKIVVGPQTQNTFQNVFLNVVPTTTISPVPIDNKDTNQNVFLNINNTFQRYVPTIENQVANLNVSQLFTESKSEELSVEIDPTDFGLGDEGNSETEEDPENGINDWEDVISAMKIASRSNGATSNGKHLDPAKTTFGTYVPILPKQTDEKMDFSNSGEHFLSPQLYSPLDFNCETCQKPFTSRLGLRFHIKNFHMGKYPFKCDYCRNEYMCRVEYEACMKYHKSESDSLTLNDFKDTSLEPDKGATTESEAKPDLTDLVCDICHRQFNSPSGLLRHKVRKHNQKSKKKYFIKGMKNAKCDICNREFSTQSYMQLHRKLHLRDDVGYKYKVFGRTRYLQEKKAEESEQKSDNQDTSNKEGEAEVKKEEESNSDEEN
ncbi:zinc finger protein 227 [Tribolium castaneum]|nr:PREDICTED: uncharacterized protein LOC100142210 [Tribolium castaneum]|eukprot:XP_001814896.2 PREDICTED: uncharacterized protein LOC100142210 [Tribolium castaneum]